MSFVDFIGYLASVFVVLSFFIRSNIIHIRTINLVGCVLFVIYGILIKSIPVVLPNGILIFVQLYYLLYNKD